VKSIHGAVVLKPSDALDHRVDVETSRRWTHPKPPVCYVTLAAVPTAVELISVRRFRHVRADASLQVSPANPVSPMR